MSTNRIIKTIRAYVHYHLKPIGVFVFLQCEQTNRF